jgi:RNA polymerase sigma-70 factor, ECF subfamily
VTSDELDRMRNGDQVAIAAVWRRCNPLVLRYLRVRGCADADDVAAQVWLEVARGLHRFEGDGAAFARWLFTLTHRRLLDASRRRRRRRDEATAVVPERTGHHRDDPTTVDLDAALALLRRLPPSQSEAVALRVLGGFTPEEAGQILGRSPGAIRVLTHRGLTRLKDLLTADHATQGRGVTPRHPAALTHTDG